MPSILNWIADNFKKDPSKMLIWTGVAGWSLSSAAQIGALVFNPKLSPDQKSFLIPQECFDAFVNIASFFLVTQSAKTLTKNLYKTGKFAPSKVRNFLEKNKDLYKDKVGKLDFDLDSVLQKQPDKNLYQTYNTYKSFGTTVATVGAGILSSNIITPIIRNKMASNAQKEYKNTTN